MSARQLIFWTILWMCLATGSICAFFIYGLAGHWRVDVLCVASLATGIAAWHLAEFERREP
jgi:hypothetical protein